MLRLKGHHIRGNQKVSIIQKNQGLKVTLKQDKSTPGIIIKNVLLSSNEKWLVTFRTGGADQKLHLVFLNEKIKLLDGRAVITTGNQKTYDLYLVVSSPQKGQHFWLHDFSIKKMTTSSVLLDETCSQLSDDTSTSVSIPRNSMGEIKNVQSDRSDPLGHFDQVYLINLARRPERLSRVSKLLQWSGIDYHRITGVDGRDIGLPPHDHNISTEGAYGCLLSHLAVYQLSKQRGHRRVLVLEDDICIHRNFDVILSEFMRGIPSDWKLLYFGGSQKPGTWTSLAMESISQEVSYYRARLTRGTFAYAFDCSIVDDLINMVSSKSKPIDFYLSDIQERYPCYVSYPNLIISDVTSSDTQECRDQCEFGNKMHWRLSDYVWEPENKMRVLVTSTQYPYYGGAATNAYYLTKHLKKYCSAGVLFFDNKHSTSQFDPENVGNVNYSDLSMTTISSLREEITAQLRGKPTLILAFNWLAPQLSRKLYPEAKVIFCTTGSSIVTDLSRDGISLQKYLRTNPTGDDSREINAICASDCVLFNSYLIQNLFERVYPQFSHKYIQQPLELTDVCGHPNSAESITSHKGGTCDSGSDVKRYDIIYVCSSLKRSVKNIPFVMRLMTHPSLVNYRKLIIGNDSDQYAENVPNLQTLKMVDNPTVNQYMSKSKLLILPSYIESFGIVAREAEMNQCLVLTSRNAGISYRLSEIFVCDDVYDHLDWIRKIHFIISNYDDLTHLRKIEYLDQTGDIVNRIRHLNEAEQSSHADDERSVTIMGVDTPYHGGCGTNCYNMLKAFRSKGIRSSLIFMDSNMTHPIDPDGLSDVYRLADRRDVPLLQRQIYSSWGIPEIVICKNYQTVEVARVMFPKARVVYSPSGSRLYSLNCSITRDFIPATDFISVSDSDKLKHDPVEEYAFENSDLIIPNSRLTHQLISKFHKHREMTDPVHMSSLMEVNGIDRLSFESRPIDVVAIAHNWKRKVKNADFLVNLAQCLKRHKITLHVIGGGVGDKSPLIVYHENASRTTVLNLLCQTKTVVIPSWYDSNPNVANEARMMGCNVVCSVNVGISTFFDQRLVVRNLRNLNEWSKAITVSMSGEFPDSLPDKFTEFNRLCGLLWPRGMSSRAPPKIKDHCLIFCHSVPSVWSTPHGMSLLGTSSESISSIRNLRKEEWPELSEFIRSDGYYEQLKHVYLKSKNLTEYHVVICSRGHTVPAGWIRLSEIFPNEPHSVIFWRFTNIDQLMTMKGGSVYFLRGKYDLVYRSLLSDGGWSINYPATSLPCTKKLLTCPTPYNVVLYDDPEHLNRLKSIYKSPLRLYEKYNSSMFINLDLNRVFHICYCTNTGQTTKNHRLFFDLLDYLERNTLDLNVAFVGDLSLLSQELTLRLNKALEYDHVHLACYDRLDRSELVNIYNQSVAMVSFSGRDANPRVLGESQSCGCYNLVLDTLTDGKCRFIRNPVLGEIIRTYERISTQSDSVMAVPDDRMFKNIYDATQRHYDHHAISKTAQQLSSNSVDQLLELLDLSNMNG